MAILPQHTRDDIRRLHDVFVARLAFDFRCEQSDVRAIINPQTAVSSSTAAAAVPEQASDTATDGMLEPSSPGPVPSVAPDFTPLHISDPPEGGKNEAEPEFQRIGKVATLTDRVRATHIQHPTWTARMIANEIGAMLPSVQTILATVRRRASEAPKPEPEFAGRKEMLGHYDAVSKRLGRPS